MSYMERVIPCMERRIPCLLRHVSCLECLRANMERLMSYMERLMSYMECLMSYMERGIPGLDDVLFWNSSVKKQNSRVFGGVRPAPAGIFSSAANPEPKIQRRSRKIVINP